MNDQLVIELVSTSAHSAVSTPAKASLCAQERLRRENEALRAVASTSTLLASSKKVAMRTVATPYDKFKHDNSEVSENEVDKRLEAELAALRGNNAQLRVQQEQLRATVQELQDSRCSAGTIDYKSPDPLRRHNSFRSYGSNDEVAWPLTPGQRADASTSGNPWLARPESGLPMATEQPFPLLHLVPKLIREGGYLWKVSNSRGSTPKRRWFRISAQKHINNSGMASELALTWCDPRKRAEDPQSLDSPTGFESPEKRLRSLKLVNVVELRSGCETAAWWVQASSRKAMPDTELCWSLISEDGVTVDLAAESIQEAHLWKEGLQRIIAEMRQQSISASSNRGGRPKILDRTLSSCAQERAISPLTRPRRLSEPSPSMSGNNGDHSSLQLQHRIAAAVRDGRVDEVSSIFMSHDFSADQIIDKTTGDTTLLHACRLGVTPIVVVALKHGARNDPHPTWGGTALHIAVAGRHTDAARALLDAATPSGADAAIVNHVILANGRTEMFKTGDAPLHLAAKLLDQATVQLLLEHHADVLARDNQGRTPAHIAIEAAQDKAYNIVALLLDAANDALVDATDDVDGNSLLHVAALYGARQCVELLLQAAANANALNNAGQNPRETAIHAGKYEIARIVRSYEETSCRPPLESVRHEANNVLLSRARKGLETCAGVSMLTNKYSCSQTANPRKIVPFSDVQKDSALPSSHGGRTDHCEGSTRNGETQILKESVTSCAVANVGVCGRQRERYNSDTSNRENDGDWPGPTTEPSIPELNSAHSSVKSPGASPAPATLNTASHMGDVISTASSVDLLYSEHAPNVYGDGMAFYMPDGEQWVELYCEEEQYPYFLQVSTGHTQWVDPRTVDVEKSIKHLAKHGKLYPSDLEETSAPVVDTVLCSSASVVSDAQCGAPSRGGFLVESSDYSDCSPSTVQPTEKWCKRRSLSGGPLATAVDIFTVAGGKREPSPARSLSEADVVSPISSVYADARSTTSDQAEAPSYREANAVFPITASTEPSLVHYGVGEQQDLYEDRDVSNLSEHKVYNTPARHGIQRFPSCSSVITRDDSHDEYSALDRMDNDDLTDTLPTEEEADDRMISPIKRLETDEQLMEELGDAIFDESDDGAERGQDLSDLVEGTDTSHDNSERTARLPATDVQSADTTLVHDDCSEPANRKPISSECKVTAVLMGNPETLPNSEQHDIAYQLPQSREMQGCVEDDG